MNVPVNLSGGFKFGCLMRECLGIIRMGSEYLHKGVLFKKGELHSEGGNFPPGQGSGALLFGSRYVIRKQYWYFFLIVSDLQIPFNVKLRWPLCRKVVCTFCFFYAYLSQDP